MDVINAITGRASTRAFTAKPVPKELIHEILNTARWAPSGVNSQPWKVAVATGEMKQRVGEAIISAIQGGQKPNPDYKYYADKFAEPYRSRQVACGKALYHVLGISREDKPKRTEQWMKNYHGFGAPAELFIFIEDTLEVGSWVDTGMFIQNIMLAARGYGLETCPQAAMAEFPEIVRSTLGVPDSQKLICGIAIGFADREHPVNNYRTERDSVESFTRWYGFENRPQAGLK